MSDERVLCVPSDYVDAVLRLDESDADKLAMLLDHKEYIPRSQCETDPSYQQLIPYVVVRCGGLILAYQRKGSETRLDGLWSIGIGGHVNDTDEGWLSGVVREIREETGFDGAIGMTGQIPPNNEWAPLSGPLGFLRSDLTAVDRVHLGVLYELRVPDVNAVHMTECADYRWFDRIHAGGLNLENWSRMALDVLKAGA